MADVLRVLYVDDEPGLLEISKLFLEKLGAFSVDTLSSAREALTRLNSERYDVIISDYLMPEMDGIMFLMELKASGNTTPFIIFTGRGREEVAIKALNEGADFYIQKGGDPESQYVELAHKIRSAVSRQRTEKQAMDTEKRLHDITNFLPDATFAIDNEGNVIAWNRAIEEMTGVPARDMLGKGNYEYSIPFYGERRPILIDLVSIPDDERTTGRYSNIRKEGSVITAETSLPRPSGRYAVLMGRASVLYNSKGDVVGAIESIRDITEQKRNEESLGESGQKYRLVIEQSNDGIFIAQDGLLVFHNPSFATLTGYSSADLYGRSIADLIAPEDRDLVLTRHRERSAGEALPEEYEFSVLHHDGTTRIRVIMHISSASVGGRPATIGTLHNVTEERRREEALRVSEEKYRSVIENIQDMFYRSDMEGNLIMASPSCIRKLGYGSIDEIINKPISETFYISPEKRKELVRIIEEKGSIEDSEVQLKRKDGSPLWVTSSSHHYRDENGMIAGIEGIFHDISERKRAEEALQESHDRFEATIASLDDAIFLVDPATRLIIECNDAATRIFGYSYEELVGSETTSLHVDRAHVEQFGREAKATYEVPGYYTREFEMRRKDGCVFPTEHFVRPIHDPDGRILYVVSLVRDITERKLADKALRESEDRYRKLVEISPDSVILHQEGKIIYLNPAAVTLIGATSPDEIIGNNVLDYIQTDFREAVKTNIQKDLAGVSTSLMELPMVRPDGTRVIVEGRGIRTVSNGKPAVQVTLKDVTASREAERVLQESELLFREVFNHANDAVFLLERTPHGPGNYLLVNDKAVRMLGYSKEELLELSPRDIVPEETQKKIMPVVIKKLLKDGHATFESSHRRKDGSIYPVEVSTHTFRYKEKDVDLSIVRDITERKRAEELARESEVRFRTVFENAGDAIAVHDPEGNFVEVNDVICRRLGYSREELLTMKVVDVDDPVHACNVEGRIRELTKNGHIVFETVHNTRDGRQITEEVSAVLIHLGNKPYVMSIARDITERKELEKEMEHHAQELRKFSTSLAAANKKFTLLSSVTRHDINNQLAMLRGYLAILEDSKPAPSQEEYFQKASAAAQRISAMIHFTKEYEQIGVSSPVWQDLCTLVETAAKQTQLGKINVKNELTGGIEVFADPLIIKVFYNLMDNAVRYGGKITTIRFSVEESGDDQIIVCEDDGVGVVAEEKAKVFDREFGKNTGLGLFLSREILDITGITITETGEPGKGARFEMVVPDGAWRIAEAVKKQG